MALIDARMLDDDARIESDLCVIGGGAAGLAIASHFAGGRRRVVVVESGGLEPDAETQSLYAGPVVGQIHAPLDTCRLRYFGGTTNHWTAHVRPLAEIDFAARPWVPNSGWPFDRDALAPYYERARGLLGVPADAFEVEGGQAFADAGLAVSTRYIVPEARRRLGPRLRPTLEASPNVDVLLHANVVRIVPTESQREVAELALHTLGGRRATVRARHTVLATGGIENPRILLLSGIGSAPDDRRPVGAYFANHPEGWGGLLQPIRALGDLKPFNARRWSGGGKAHFLRLSPETQREASLANCWIELIPSFGEKKVLRAVARQSTDADTARPEVRAGLLAKDVASLAREFGGIPKGAAGRRALGVRIFPEPTPNRSSRVRLGDARDALGQPRAVLDWRLEPADAECVHGTLRTFGRMLGAAGLARLRSVFPASGFDTLRTVQTHHHMGTTRMHPDPARGVVDARCRVHGFANLWVAGSSVFPTSGTANPTYTILALAFRLAEQLDGELG